MPIFNTVSDYKHFLKAMMHYQLEGPKPRFSSFNPNIHRLDYNRKIVNLVCYCLMPNHFHFLLQQLRDSGLTEFVSKLSNSYTKYFNTKNQRAGPIFQGEFKAVHIESDEQLVHLSRYIHLNPVVDYVAKDLNSYPWSSYGEYLGLTSAKTCAKAVILDQFPGPQNHAEFVSDQENYAKNLEFIKHQLLDYPQVRG